MLFITNQVILLFFYEEGTIERGVSKYGQRGGSYSVHSVLG